MFTLHPTAGVRLLLELESDDDAGARYRAAVITPAERHVFSLVIELPSGAVKLAAADADAKGEDLLRMLARTVFKDATATEPPSWPRRILRWRDKEP